MAIIGQSVVKIKAGDRMYGGRRHYLDLVYTDKTGAKEHAQRMRKKGRTARVVRLKGKYWGIYVLSLRR